MAAFPAHDSAAVPLPLDQYAQAFDDLFHTPIQRRRFRDYLAGLLLPRDRNKTRTALAGAEPSPQAQTAPVQQLQFCVSEADWGAEAVTTRRIERLRDDPLTPPHAEGALVIDETGVRKDGTHTAHVGYQYLGTIGKTANGLVAVTSLWADQRVSYPLHVRPSTPAWQAANSTPPSAPSRSSPWSWCTLPGPLGSPSAPWWLTASTANTPNSSARCGGRGGPPAWRGQPPPAPGAPPPRAAPPPPPGAPARGG